MKLDTQMVEILRIENRVLFLKRKGKWKKSKALTLIGVFIDFPLDLSNLSTSSA